VSRGAASAVGGAVLIRKGLAMELVLEVTLMCLFIFTARICDVSLATLRMLSVVNGRRGVAWVLGALESLIWLLAVSGVFSQLNDPFYGPFYMGAWSLGYATGGAVGMTVERWFAFGRQAVRVFTRKEGVDRALRAAGFTVTRFDGSGRDGVVHELFVATKRKAVNQLIAAARELDDACFYTVEDVRQIALSSPSLALGPRGPMGMIRR